MKFRAKHQQLTHFAAHLQCTQANAAKANIAKELQAHASASRRITINFLQNLINKTNPNNLCPPTTQFAKSLIPHHTHKQLILESDGSPPQFYYSFINF